MANLTAVAGALTASTGTITNTKFIEWSNAYIRAKRTISGLPVAENATNQEKLQYVINQIGREFRDTAINQLKKEAEETAGASTAATEGATDWS
jgi:hypothetical protein